MDTINVGSITGSIRNIKRIPLLGWMLKTTRLSSRTAVLLLGPIALFMLYLPVTAVDALRMGNAYKALILILLACIIGIPVALAVLSIARLDQMLNRYNLGSFHEWIDCFFGKRSKLPKRMPQKWGRKIQAILAILVSGVFGLMTIVSLISMLPTLAKGLLTLYLNLSSSDPDSQANLLGVGVGTFIGAVGAPLIFLGLQNASWRFYRRLASVPSSVILQKDPRKPILLLRSFGDDDIKFKQGSFESKKYFEEELATDFWREGPVVAIGRPGERLPKFGACREYHTNDSWQARIMELIEQSRTVVMMVGLTDALGWEINQLRNQHALLSKSLFIIPPLPDQEIGVRLQKFISQVPEFADTYQNQHIKIQHVLFVAFNEDGHPICFVSKNKSPLDYTVAAHAAFVLLRY